MRALLVVVLVASQAHAEVTQVVLMRAGRRTVVSIQPGAGDAPLTLPVPASLQRADVHVLPAGIFERVEQVSAPRLVEYVQRDPCEGPSIGELGTRGSMQLPLMVADRDAAKLKPPLDAGESEATLQAAPGGKVLVVKAPVRFHYDSDAFTLRLPASSDVLVHVFAPGTRCEVAGRPSAVLPARDDLAPDAGSDLSPFYVSLFERLLAKAPATVVTEHARLAGHCDLCPAEKLTPEELALLGFDVLGLKRKPVPNSGGLSELPPFGHSRLHMRLDAPAELAFRPAAPLGADGRVTAEKSRFAPPGGTNRFEPTYAVRRPWPGKAACEREPFVAWDRAPGSEVRGASRKGAARRGP